MTRHYLRLALKVLVRRKFFTFVSLFGTAFTLLVLTVVAALAEHALAPAAPETRQNRTLQSTWAVMYGDHGTWSSQPGFKLFDRYARDLPGVERLSIFSSLSTANAFVDGRKIALQLKRTDAEFWRILEFAFVEGRPYSSDDVHQARMVAVLSRSARRLLLGDAPAEGASIDIDGRRFRVVGVVDDVSELRTVPYADIWVPHTTATTAAYRDELMGGFSAIALAREGADLSAIRTEFNDRLARVEPPDPKTYRAIVAPFETKAEAFARLLPTSNRRSVNSQLPGLIALASIAGLLFALLPALNLVNITISRVLERSSEIGVRKAFGASSRTLVAQFLVENVVLTLVGAAIAFVLAMLVLDAINRAGFIAHAALRLDAHVFGWGVLFALGFGVLSGVWPAWRMSRLRPVDALKGSIR